MPNRLLRILAVSIGMFAYLANTTVLGSGLVLCAEPDGRVAVELVGDHDPCLTAPMILCSGDEAGCAEHLECDEHCICGPCPCNDTPFGIVFAPLQKRAQLVNSSVGATCPTLASPQAPNFRHGGNYVAPYTNTHLNNRAQARLLRSVVRLI